MIKADSQPFYHSQDVLWHDATCNPIDNWYIPLDSKTSKVVQSILNPEKKQFRSIGKSYGITYVQLEKFSQSDEPILLLILRVFILCSVFFPWFYEYQKYVKKKELKGAKLQVNPHFRGNGPIPTLEPAILSRFQEWTYSLKQGAEHFIEKLVLENRTDVFSLLIQDRANVNILISPSFVEAFSISQFEQILKGIREHYSRAFEIFYKIGEALEVSKVLQPYDSLSEQKFRLTNAYLLSVTNWGAKPVSLEPNFKKWNTLPKDILRHIFGYLVGSELGSVAKVCIDWNRAVFCPKFFPFENRISSKLEAIRKLWMEKKHSFLLQKLSLYQLELLLIPTQISYPQSQGSGILKSMLQKSTDIEDWLNCWDNLKKLEFLDSRLVHPDLVSLFPIYQKCCEWILQKDPQKKEDLIERNIFNHPDEYLYFLLVLQKGTDDDIENLLKFFLRAEGCFRFLWEIMIKIFTFSKIEVRERLAESLVKIYLQCPARYQNLLNISWDRNNKLLNLIGALDFKSKITKENLLIMIKEVFNKKSEDNTAAKNKMESQSDCVVS